MDGRCIRLPQFGRRMSQLTPKSKPGSSNARTAPFMPTRYGVARPSSCPVGGLSLNARITHRIDVIQFLDFDGVLHPAGVLDESYMVDLPAFEEVLRRYKERVQVVVSSDWRKYETIGQLRARFSEDLRHLVVGVTPQLEGNRQSECEAWLRENAPGAHWLAVDDDLRGFSPGCPQLFLVPKTGLEPKVAKQLAARIEQELDRKP